MERCPKSPIYSDHMYSQARIQPYPRHCLFCHRPEPELLAERKNMVLHQYENSHVGPPIKQINIRVPEDPIRQLAVVSIDHKGKVTGQITAQNVQEFRQAIVQLQKAEYLFERGGS